MGDSSYSLILHFNNDVVTEKKESIEVVNESINESINESTNEYINESSNESSNESINESINEFYEEVIDKTKKIICDICGGSYTYYTKKTHIKTNKHMKNL